MQPPFHFKYSSDPAAKLIYMVLSKPAIPQPEFNVGADNDTTQANNKYPFVGFQPKIIDV